MLFSGIPFLFYFLPIVIVVYAIAPKRCKNLVLLAASLVFYAWGEPRLVVVMAFAIVVGYVLGLVIDRYRGTWKAKLGLALSLAVSLGFLCYYKYADFFISSFNAVTGLSIPLLGVALPIGISFYTFQLLSYTFDVYRGDTQAQRSLIKLAAYISMFPQLIAGPIVRYTDVAPLLDERSHSFAQCAAGVRRFMVGLSKKILIADALAELCRAYTASQNPSVLFAWLYAVSFTLQIYFDFSGYSDMAIGLGRFFGFEFMENFRHPYISHSITEFWRRWHISLSSWFRDYVYIPMGGGRVSKARRMVNIFTVWMLTGLWHGAAWNFVIWGLYFAVLLVAEKGLYLDKLDKHRAIGHIYVILAVTLSFVVFNAPNMSSAFRDIGRMFGLGGVPVVSAEGLYYLRSYAVTLIIACIGATPLPLRILSRIRAAGAGEKALAVVEPVVLAALFLVCTAWLVDGSFSPFLYFRF